MWREKVDQHNTGSSTYAHIWEDDYAKAFEGAYFAKHLEQARQQDRIGHVAADPIVPIKAFFDIGGAGHSSDALAIWIAQFVGREIRLLDYIEGVGQPLSHYAHELRRRGWKEAIICLPHDGVATNNISGKHYIDHWTEVGFECDTPIKNSGTAPPATKQGGSVYTDAQKIVSRRQSPRFGVFWKKSKLGLS